MIGVGQWRGLEENAFIIITSSPVEPFQLDERARGKVTGERNSPMQGLEIGHLQDESKTVLTRLDAGTSISPQVQSNSSSSGASRQPPTQMSWPASNSRGVPCESITKWKILKHFKLDYHLFGMKAALFANFTSTIGITLGHRQPNGKSDNVDQ